MKNKKYIIITLIITTIIAVVVWFGLNFRPGSYPYVETYELKTNESTLINAINKLKEENPQLNVPKEVNLQDGREDSLDYWYHIYFYFPQKNEIIYCWTRPSNKGYTTFAIVAVNEGLELGHWKMINKDYNKKENNEKLHLIEQQVLDKVRK